MLAALKKMSIKIIFNQSLSCFYVVNFLCRLSSDTPNKVTSLTGLSVGTVRKKFAISYLGKQEEFHKVSSFKRR